MRTHPKSTFRSHKSTFRSHRLKIITQCLNDQNPCFFTHLHGVNLHNPSDMIWYDLNPPGVTTTPWRFAVFFVFFLSRRSSISRMTRSWEKSDSQFLKLQRDFFPSWNNWPIVNTSNGPSNFTSTSIQSYPFLKNTDVLYILVTTKNLSWSNLAPVTDTSRDFTIPKRIAL